MTVSDMLGKNLLIADGAMGTQLQEAGLAPGEAPTLWNITRQDAVLGVHRAYLDAGASYLTTNTFGANALKLAGTPYSVSEVISAGVRIAREAVRLEGGEGLVALDIGPLGELLKPMGQLGFERAYELFAEQVEAGAGTDFILIETMIDTYELKAAVLAAQEQSDLPVFATVAVSTQGRLLNGADVRGVCTLLEGLGVDALGLNCGAGPLEVAEHAKALQGMASTPVVICPNAGMPEVKDGQAVYATSPEEFVAQMEPLAAQQVAVVGGCCGTTPAFIKALATAYGGRKLAPITPKQRGFVTSYASSLALDEGEPRIDARIDPVINEALAEALLRGDYEHCIDDALDAQDDDADIIGICAVYPGIDEGQALPAMVEAVQAMINIPLMITGAMLDAFERALRIYNGCALADTSRVAPEEADAARALASRYGAVIRE